MRYPLTQIQAWYTRLDALSDEEIEDLSCEDAAADLGKGVAYVGELLAQLRAASEAIPSSLVPTNGEVNAGAGTQVDAAQPRSTQSIAYALQCLNANTFRNLNRWDGDDQRSCVACDYGVADDDPLAHTPPLTDHESDCAHVAHVNALRAFLRAENVLAEQQGRLDDVVLIP